MFSKGIFPRDKSSQTISSVPSSPSNVETFIGAGTDRTRSGKSISLHCCCYLSDSMQPHRRQPTRLPSPWDSPGKNTGVGCHFLLQCMKVKSQSEVTQSCPTLSGPMDCSPPGSSVHGIFQARVLEWGAIAFWFKIGFVWVLTFRKQPFEASTDDQMTPEPLPQLVSQVMGPHSDPPHASSSTDSPRCPLLCSVVGALTSAFLTLY